MIVPPVLLLGRHHQVGVPLLAGAGVRRGDLLDVLAITLFHLIRAQQEVGLDGHGPEKDGRRQRIAAGVLHLKDQAETFIDLVRIFVLGVVGEVVGCLAIAVPTAVQSWPSPNMTNCWPVSFAFAFASWRIDGLAKWACRTPEPLTYTTSVEVVSVVGPLVATPSGYGLNVGCHVSPLVVVPAAVSSRALEDTRW